MTEKINADPSATYSLELPLLMAPHEWSHEQTIGTYQTLQIPIENKGEGRMNLRVLTSDGFIVLKETVIPYDQDRIVFDIDLTQVLWPIRLVGHLYLYGQGIAHHISLKIQGIAPIESLKNEPKTLEMISRPRRQPYTRPDWHIALTKGSYLLGEMIKVTMVNSLNSPITVEVVGISPGFTNKESILTVTDIATLNIEFKLNIWQKLVEHFNHFLGRWDGQLHLRVHSEGDSKTLTLPLKVMALEIGSGRHPALDERSFKKGSLLVQQLFYQYLMDDQKEGLKKAVERLTGLLTYRPGDLRLHLFRILMLHLLEDYEVMGEAIFGLEPLMQDATISMKQLYSRLREWASTGATMDLGGFLEDIMLDQSPYDKDEVALLMAYEWLLFYPNKVDYTLLEELYQKGYRGRHIQVFSSLYFRQHRVLPKINSFLLDEVLLFTLLKGYDRTSIKNQLVMVRHRFRNEMILRPQTVYILYAMEPDNDILELCVSVFMMWQMKDARALRIYELAMEKLYYNKGLEEIYLSSAYANQSYIRFDLYHENSLANHPILEEQLYGYYRHAFQKEAPSHMMVFDRHQKEILKAFINKPYPGYGMELLCMMLTERFETHQWQEAKVWLNHKVMDLLCENDESCFIKLLKEIIRWEDSQFLIHNLSLSLVWRHLDEEGRKNLITMLIKNNIFDWVMEAYRAGLLYDQSPSIQVAAGHKLATTDEKAAVDLISRAYMEGLVSQEVRHFMIEHPHGDYAINQGLYRWAVKEAYPHDLLLERLALDGIESRQNPVIFAMMFLKDRDELTRLGLYDKVLDYLSAQILIENAMGLEALVEAYEGLTMQQEKTTLNLALLKLYHNYGVRTPWLAEKTVRNVVLSGIIMPWFSEIAPGIMDKKELRKVHMISYHGLENASVKLCYYVEDQEDMLQLTLTHVAFGLYIGYVIGFYDTIIDYYFVEEDLSGASFIKNSDSMRLVHVPRYQANMDGYDYVNTSLMARSLQDEASMMEAMREYANEQIYYSNQLTVMDVKE